MTDDSGATVTIHGEPQRIVSLAPTNTEILFALGLGDRVVGVTDYCDYPAEAKTKPSIGGYSTVSVENVIAQKPDLIVASYGKRCRACRPTAKTQHDCHHPQPGECYRDLK